VEAADAEPLEAEATDDPEVDEAEADPDPDFLPLREPRCSSSPLREPKCLIFIFYQVE